MTCDGIDAGINMPCGCRQRWSQDCPGGQMPNLSCPDHRETVV
ncbi:hypothetical protein CGRA01v4_09339 [Colletotrichum graminicola]|nr:hypothetical protein CGRA01v4_09339 [Colletotrichum graminicola]